jgi:hypothetical protein
MLSPGCPGNPLGANVAGMDGQEFPGELLYHLALRSEWQDAVEGDDYRQSTLSKDLSEEGFILCSFASRERKIAEFLYRGVLTCCPRSKVLVLSRVIEFRALTATRPSRPRPPVGEPLCVCRRL